MKISDGTDNGPWFDEKDENFNLQEYCNNSFGIYQEDPYNVVLEFNKETAEDVLNYHFHPTQKVKVLDNGNVEVKFKSGGKLAMCFEFFKWGNRVKIKKPTELREYYRDYLKWVLDNMIEIKENQNKDVKKLTVDKIIAKTAKYFNVSKKDILSDEKAKQVADARRFAIFLSKEILDLDFSDIAKKFNKNTTTIMYLYEKLRQDISKNKKMQTTLEELRKIIQM